MDNEKLKVIKDACVRANLQIMEFGFGCEFENGDHENGTIVSVTENHPFMFSMHWIDSKGSRRSAYDVKKEEFEILGRPIRLADVLLAIGRKYISGSKEADMEFSMEHWYGAEEDKNDHLAFYVPTLVEKEKLGWWNLLKDDLRDQSEETVDFLYELLK